MTIRPAAAVVFVVAFSLLCGIGIVGVSRAEYPTPSVYPVSWQLEFEHDTPKRVVVDVPGQGAPQAYWYMTYTVTNNSDNEQTFLPIIELMTRDGKLVRSDKNIALKVFNTIKSREGKKLLEEGTQIGGAIRLGETQAKDGVAIWREPEPEMGTFSIFVGGLSGESTTMKGPDDKPVILRKTLQLNYIIRGDEVYPGEDEVNENASEWVMR
jgi:hypothetical protein